MGPKQAEVERLSSSNEITADKHVGEVRRHPFKSELNDWYKRNKIG